MTLEDYRRVRMVILSSGTSAYEAARAMESNHVGMVIVQDRGSIVGVVTDRDMALRVVGYELDPTQTPLHYVMTGDPATLPISASEEEALELMRDRHIRRIPLLEGERVAGLVTLDDLLLSETADRHVIAEVVREQLAEPADMKPAGEVHPVRPARPRPEGGPPEADRRGRDEAR
jgi:signal-transduction protein with cAMP-binding, CBS, and nucleotidyltransferase domain